MLDDATRRRDFPTLTGRAYLNTAAEGIPPLAVGEALAEYFRDKQQGMDGRIAHAAQWDAARALAAEFYGLTPEEIGLCSSSAEAYNLAALALRLQPGDEVVISDLDFPSGSTPWLQPTCPATVKVWRARDGGLRLEDLVPLLTPRTRFVTASLVSYYNGFLLDAPALVETVLRHSPALLSLDVTQALGRVPLNLAGVDLIVSSTHKWILASHGGGIVGVPKAREKELTVPAGGWFNLQNPFEADRFDRPAASKPGAASFMCGMPNYAAVYAIRAGLEYIRQIGVVNIDRAARPLVHACLEGLAKLPVQVITPHEDAHLAGIVAFLHPEMERIVRALRDAEIHVMGHTGRIRIAIHGYNQRADIEKLLRVLEEVLPAA
ncbi:MAG TPA: aminotransferase class V-fold PLP-dependent enzyme [Chthonomonadaceae bacterium]|nr:aminotransferase class V-fold PLP-dependent enzyme [Chthonomonadaceae bacterium]